MGKTQPEKSSVRKLRGFNQPQAETSLEAEVPRVLNRTTGIRVNRKEAVGTGLGSHRKEHRTRKREATDGQAASRIQETTFGPRTWVSAPPPSLLWLCVHGVWQGLAPPPWVQGRRRGRKGLRGELACSQDTGSRSISRVIGLIPPCLRSGPLFPFVCITPDWNACCCLCVVLNQSSVMTNMNVSDGCFPGPFVASIKG